MSAKTDEILESLKSLSLLEASELVKQIEEAFGVSAAASAGVVMAAPGAAAGGDGGEAAEDHDETISWIIVPVLDVPTDSLLERSSGRLLDPVRMCTARTPTPTPHPPAPAVPPHPRCARLCLAVIRARQTNKERAPPVGWRGAEQGSERT